MNQIFQVYGNDDYPFYMCDREVYRDIIKSADELFGNQWFREKFDRVTKFNVGESENASFLTYADEPELVYEGEEPQFGENYIEHEGEVFIKVGSKDDGWLGPDISIDDNQVMLTWTHKHDSDAEMFTFITEPGGLV